MYLGIDQQSGLVYEGIEGPVLPVVPRPTVTPRFVFERSRAIPIAAMSPGKPGGYTGRKSSDERQGAGVWK